MTGTDGPPETLIRFWCDGCNRSWGHDPMKHHERQNGPICKGTVTPVKYERVKDPQ